MNKLTIIGNLTRDPDPLRVARTPRGEQSVCSISVAVNAPNKEHTDFFRVTVWGKAAESCAKYLSKGRKVAVFGPVTLHEYTDKNGKARAELDVTAQEIEFLGAPERGDAYDNPDPPAHKIAPKRNDDNELPF